MCRGGKSPDLDVERCLKVSTPIEFLRVLWAELTVCSSVGELETCRRIATYVLTTPRCPNLPPLLPIFLHHMVPSLLMIADHQPSADQSMSLELMVAVISSALSAALHLEWAFHMTSHDHKVLLGQTTTSMARRFVQDLRTRTDTRTVKMLAQRMASSQNFVTNFPMFLGELAIG